MKIQVLTFLAFLLLWLPVFGILNSIITKHLSYSIDRRYLHFRLIIAGFIVSLIASSPLVSSYSLLLVDKLINLPFLAPFFNKFLPNRAYELLYMVLCTLGLNLLYMLGLVIVFAVTKAIFKKQDKFIEYEHCVGTDRLVHAPWRVVNKFYSDAGGKPELSGAGHSLGICARGMKWVFAIIWICGLAILYYSILWGKEAWNEAALTVTKAVYLLPMVAFVMTEQVQLFLEGPEDKSIGSFGSSEIGEKMIGDMDSLMRRYQDIFGGSGMLLCAERGPKHVVGRQGLGSNDLGNQQLNDCDEPEILSAISNQLRESGVHQNPNYQNAVISLLNGNSINVRDIGSGEFTIYLCAYLNYFLAQGRAAIVLCADKAEAAHMKAVLEEKTEKLGCIDGIFRICEMNELVTVSNVGILICTHEDLLKTDLINNYKSLSADMMCAVIPNCSSVMALDGVRTERLFGRLRAFPNMRQYVFLSEEDNESLRVKLKNYLPDGAKMDAFGNDQRVQNSNVMIWKEESVYRPQMTLNIGNNASPYLGTALPLALVAAKYDLPQVNVIPDEQRGDSYFFGGARSSNEVDIVHYLEKNLDLNSIIRYSVDDAMLPHNLKVFAVYDSDFNYFNALWRWFKYAGKDGTLLHVVSPFYMMREYFAANAKSKKLLYSNNENDALLPNEKAAKRTLLASILASLADEGMTEEELMGASRKYGWDYPDVAALLKDAVLTVRYEREFHSVYEHFSFKQEKVFDSASTGFVQRMRIRLNDDNMLKKQKAQISLAKLSYKLNEDHELPVLNGNLWNYFLPGQTIPFDGSYYTVSSIDRTEGRVHTSAADPTAVPEYFAVCDYSLSDYRLIDNCIDNPIMDCNLCVANAEKIIYGYISTNNGNDFSKESKPVINRLNGVTSPYPKAATGNVPVFEINILRESFGSDETAEKATALLCVLLNGLFKTLFPRTWQNIAAVPDLPIDSELIDRVMNHPYDYRPEDLVRASIPRISVDHTDRNDKYVRLYIIECSCIEYGMVRTVYEKLATVLDRAYQYLDWYIASNKAAAASEESDVPAKFICGRYLHFGLDHIPDIFAPEALRTFLSDYIGNTQPETAIVPDDTETVAAVRGPVAVCSFCNREIVFAWQLSDGRCMCAHCHDHQKTSKDEIKSLFIETKNMLESHYHISFRKDIHVRFRSADAIRAAAGGSVGSRIVGFYSHGKRQLWIESRGPSVAMESTIIHELTHAWQHDNLPLKKLERALPRKLRDKRVLLLLEGHAVYVEIEAMREKGEAEYAERLKNTYLAGSDEYSEGYKLICACFEAMQDLGSINAFERMSILVEKIIEEKGANITWPNGY